MVQRMPALMRVIAAGAALLLGCIGGVPALATQAEAPPESTRQETVPATGNPEITRVLIPIRQKHRVPALCGAVVTSKGLVAAGVVGMRKQGSDIPATLDDLWHLGSETKAMTATLAARLVERSQMQWDTTVSEVFPDLAPQFQAELKSVTVKQLLSHRAGLRANLDLASYRGTNVLQERRRAVAEELAKKPEHPPGSRYRYSNLGYIIVGAMMEKITGQTWEQSITKELFTPLGMSRAGFGGTGTPGQIDQPWGHRANGRPVVANGPAVDNPPVLGPAGRVHSTIQDWANFVADQLRGARGEPALLGASGYKALHTPLRGEAYALGWLVVERAWGGGTVLNHTGDNTMNHANVWIAPKRDFAILICINQGGDEAFRASDEAVAALIQQRNSRP